MLQFLCLCCICGRLTYGASVKYTYIYIYIYILTNTTALLILFRNPFTVGGKKRKEKIKEAIRVIDSIGCVLVVLRTPCASWVCYVMSSHRLMVLRKQKAKGLSLANNRERSHTKHVYHY